MIARVDDSGRSAEEGREEDDDEEQDDEAVGRA